MPTPRRFHIPVLLALVVLSSLAPVAAQTAEPPEVTVLHVTDALALYRYDGAGNATLLTTLPQQFTLFGYPVYPGVPNQVSIPGSENIAVSPDGSRVAVLGQDSASSGILNVYATGGTLLNSINVPGAGALTWSPTGEAILIAPPRQSGYVVPVVDSYVYDLAQNSLTQITNTPDIEEPPLVP